MLEINKIKFRPHLDMFVFKSFVGFLIDAKIKADPTRHKANKGNFQYLAPHDQISLFNLMVFLINLEWEN